MLLLYLIMSYKISLCCCCISLCPIKSGSGRINTVHSTHLSVATSICASLTGIWLIWPYWLHKKRRGGGGRGGLSLIYLAILWAVVYSPLALAMMPCSPFIPFFTARLSFRPSYNPIGHPFPTFPFIQWLPH